MSLIITVIATVLGVAVLSISLYKFTKSNLKDIDPWHTGAVSLTGLALLGFGLFNEITIDLADDRSLTLKRVEALESQVAEVREESAQANQEVAELATEVETRVATVQQQVAAVERSVAVGVDPARFAVLTKGLEDVEALKKQVESVSSSLETQSKRIAGLSSQLSKTNDQLQALLGRPIPVPQVKPQEGVVGVVLFGVNSTELSSDSKKRLDEVAKTLQTQDPQRIFITGHSDTSGNAEYNLRLAEQRAQTVADYLVERGLSKKTFVVRGLGESDPAVPTGENTPETLNRRVVIRVE